MEATDLTEWLYDESPKSGVFRSKPCFKIHEISKPHIPKLTPLRALRTLSSSSPGTLATSIFFTEDHTKELSTGNINIGINKGIQCIDHRCL